MSCSESGPSSTSANTPDSLTGAGSAGKSAGGGGSARAGSGGTATGGTSANGAGAPGASASSGGAGTPSGGAGAPTGGAGAPTGGAGAPGAAGAPANGSGSYTTNFDISESPLSESGAWKNVGLDWTFVASGGGYAFGTQTGSGGYNDSYAHLSGFPPNQSASAVIHLESGITASYNEVEILLRWSDDAHRSIGYECNLAHDGSYAQIIRWPGKLGTGLNDFAFIGSGSASNGVHDGDVFSATVTGSTITSYLNGKQLATATDSMITTGNPGIAFYWEGQAGSKKYSFTSFSAKSLP